MAGGAMAEGVMAGTDGATNEVVPLHTPRIVDEAPGKDALAAGAKGCILGGLAPARSDGPAATRHGHVATSKRGAPMTMGLKLSMWTSFFIELSPEDCLEELAQAGWSHTELSDEHSLALLERGDPATVGKAFRRVADDLGVAVTQGHLWLVVDMAPADEAKRRQVVDRLKQWLDLYLAIGIRAAVLHPGGGEHTDPEARLATQLRTLGELSAHLSGSDLSICLENCSSGDALKPILAQADPTHVGVCLDTGHLNLTDEDQAAFIHSCGPRLRALHLAENDTSGDQHNMPYARRGCVPWPAIAQALADVGYAGLLNFEVPGENGCPIPVRRLKLAYLKALGGWIFSGATATP